MPATVPVVTEELLAAYRGRVNMDPADTSQDQELTEDLQRAMIRVDQFADGTTGIPELLFEGWYLKVAAEIFDDRAGPAQFSDRFDNIVTSRSTRDPLRVVLKEMRTYVRHW